MPRESQAQLPRYFAALYAKLLLIFFVLHLGAGRAGAEPLAVPLIPQTTDLWCWAACGQMVMEFLGANSDVVAQCRQVGGSLGRNDCCGQGVLPSDCIKEGWPDFASFGFSAECSEGALSWAKLYEEIYTGRRPVVFTWLYPDKSAHSMIAIDTFVQGGFLWVLAINPQPTNQGGYLPMTYEQYVGSPHHHDHWYNFYGVRRAERPVVANCPPGGASAAPEEVLAVNSFLTPQEAARVSLERLAAAIKRDGNFGVWGLGSDVPLEKAVLGEPIQEFFVDMVNLKKLMKKEVDVEEVIRPSYRWAFPVLIDGQAVTILRVSRYGDLWKLASFGERPLVSKEGKSVTEELIGLRDLRMKQDSVPASSFFELVVPSVGASFLGYRQSQGLMLAPLVSMPTTDIIPGQLVPAYKALKTIPVEISGRQRLPG